MHAHANTFVYIITHRVFCSQPFSIANTCPHIYCLLCVNDEKSKQKKTFNRADVL